MYANFISAQWAVASFFKTFRKNTHLWWNSRVCLHAETFPLQNWISSNTKLRQGFTPLWVGPCFKPWSGVNWNLPRFSLLLHLLNTLAFYSALDSSLLYVNKINWFFVHFPSFFVGLIPIKTRNKLCPASGGTAFYHFSKKTLAVWESVLFSQ